MTRALLVAAILLLPAATLARADDPRNAATWYRRAFEAMDGMDAAHWSYIGEHASSEGRAPEVTPELRDAVRSGRKAIDLLVRGSRQPRADFELDYRQGMELVLPHLDRLRRGVRLLRAAAVVRLAEGNGRRAAELVAAGYRIAGHLESDRTLISSLIGASLFRTMDVVAMRGVGDAAFSPIDGARLLLPLCALDARDPFGVAEATAMESELVAGWAERRFAEIDDPQRFAEELGEIVDGPDKVQALAELDEAGFTEQLDAYDGMMDEVAVLFADEAERETAAELDRLGAEIEAGEHGLLSSMLGANFGIVWKAMRRSREDVADRIKVLDAFARGALDPADETNAAVLYRRAIAAFQGLDERFRIRGIGDERAPDDPEAAAALLERAAGVFDLAAHGAAQERCDFTFARDRRAPGIAPPYVAGMRDLLRLQIADARVRLARGDAAGARGRLATATAVISHLAGDGTVLSALVSHRSFVRLLAVVEEMDGAGSLTAEGRAELRERLRRIGRRDPFGYAAGLLHDRDRLGGWLRREGMRRVSDPATVATALEAVAGMDADRVLHLLAVASGTTLRDGDDGDDGDDSLDGLHDVVDLAALAAARKTGPEAATRFAEGRLDVADGADVTAIASAAKTAAEARGDLRRATTLLRSE